VEIKTYERAKEEFRMKSSFDLTGKVAIVTGGFQGLGRGMAIGLAQAGADVVLVDRAEALETASVIQSLGRKYLTVAADLMSITAIPSIVQRTIETFGKVDILITTPGPFAVRQPSTIQRKTGMKLWR
jgi:2-dehydro-3-deoxy-D-gluconate 5-dehydrogenase